MKNITAAIIKAAQGIQNIEKDMTVGTGNYSYKGVSDKDVKLIVRKAMFENGLVIVPTKVDPKTTIERWEEDYNGKPKQKQQVFTEVVTTYLLMHTSGESIELQGYGQGVDTQDKAAGKATTYALKYALLYNFLIATGSIDDADTVHSEEHQVPKEDNKPWLNEGTDVWKAALERKPTLETLRENYKVSKKTAELYLSLIKKNTEKK